MQKWTAPLAVPLPLHLRDAVCGEVERHVAHLAWLFQGIWTNLSHQVIAKVARGGALRDTLRYRSPFPVAASELEVADICCSRQRVAGLIAGGK